MPGVVGPALGPIKKRPSCGPLIYFIQFNRVDDMSFTLVAWNKKDDVLFDNPRIQSLVWPERQSCFFYLKTTFQPIIDPKLKIKNLSEPRHVFLCVFKVRKNTPNINSLIIWNLWIHKNRSFWWSKPFLNNNFFLLSRNLTPLSQHHPKERKGDILVFQIN
jgi:hypothetical protein